MNTCEILDERPFPLSEIPAHVPKKRGRKVHRSTGFRWAGRGVRGVRLETVRVGRTQFTSVAALRRFFERLTQRDVLAASSYRTPARRDREYRRALHDLAEMGIDV